MRAEPTFIYRMAAVQRSTEDSAEGLSTGLWLVPAEGAAPASCSAAVAVTRRLLDIAVALTLLTVLLPVYLAVVIAIRRDSSGPSIFKQERVGLRGRRFVLLKFRTMHADAASHPHREYVQALIQGHSSSGQGDLYKLTIDPRITKVGRGLRRWSVDELPQLINVLRGEMALVGPRPVIPYETELYPQEYWRRFAVKPGMTGLWQVSGRNTCTYEEMVQLDLEYVNRRSLWFDLKILLKTIPVVLNRLGVA
jgi:lipopolysaccharide/colanic/teichoic acid biosynthesis glycosyltransferase